MTETLRWMKQVFSSEIKNSFTYRVDFWIDFSTTVFVQLGVAFFLWKAIFLVKGVEEMGGYSFLGMMWYFLLVTLTELLIRGKSFGAISSDIYEGTLSKYLLYPVRYFVYKLTLHWAQSLLGIVQFFLAIIPFALLFGRPPELEITPMTLLWGIFTGMMSGILFFYISASLQLVAFWVDHVWSLSVMLKFLTQLCGGALIPLSLFPPWAERAASLSPFGAMISFPVKTLMGQLPWSEWLQGMGVLVFWILFFSGICQWVWRRGLRSYTGVGI